MGTQVLKLIPSFVAHKLYVTESFTPHKKLLSVHLGFSPRLLQQRDPVVHLLGNIRVAVNDPVCSDYHKGIWSVLKRLQMNEVSKGANVGLLKEGSPATCTES